MRYLLALLFVFAVACDGGAFEGGDAGADTETECDRATYFEDCPGGDCAIACYDNEVGEHDTWECKCFCQLDRYECATGMGCDEMVAGFGECWDMIEAPMCPVTEQDCYDHNPH